MISSIMSFTHIFKSSRDLKVAFYIFLIFVSIYIYIYTYIYSNSASDCLPLYNFKWFNETPISTCIWWEMETIGGEIKLKLCNIKVVCNFETNIRFKIRHHFYNFSISMKIAIHPTNVSQSLKIAITNLYRAMCV